MPVGEKVVLNNPAILAWAREEVNLTVAEVADHFHRKPETISAWEQGIDAPTFRQICDLANYYKRSVATFFLPSIPPKSPKPVDFRTLPDTTLGSYSKDVLIAYREMGNYLKEVRSILTDVETKLVYSLPSWTLEDDPHTKAEEIRALLGVTVDEQIEELSSYYKAFDRWRSVLFDFGVIASVFKMPIKEARAFCLFGSDLAGIGLSNEDREHGKIFSLFHEICHLSINKPGLSGQEYPNKGILKDIEDYCDVFSAAFLLPSSHNKIVTELANFSRNPSYENGINTARIFKVSKYVVIRKALDMGMITDALYWKILSSWKINDLTFNKKNQKNKQSGGDYHATQISYTGKRFVKLMMDAFRKELITSADIKRITGVEPSTIESYGM